MFVLGGIRGVPVAEREDLVALPVLDALRLAGALDRVEVAEIDPALSETAATEEAYGLDARTLVNCVLVGGRRDGVERVAVCLVPSTKRVDVNGFVRRRLDVRKASFLPREEAVGRSGMEFGGITAIGLPAGWPVLMDADAAAEPLVLVGSGVRRSKLLLPGSLLATLSAADVTPELARSS